MLDKGRRKMVQKGGDIALNPAAPGESVCFASGAPGLAGYVEKRERQHAHVQVFVNARGTVLH